MFNTTARKITSFVLSAVVTASLFPVCMAYADGEEALGAEDFAASESVAVNVTPAAAPSAEAPVAAFENTEAPASEVPSIESQAAEVPAPEASSEELKEEAAPSEESPAEESPAVEATVEEDPAEESPAEEVPVEEAPPEDNPAEEPRTEEAPIEEEPKEETREEEESDREAREGEEPDSTEPEAEEPQAADEEFETNDFEEPDVLEAEPILTEAFLARIDPNKRLPRDPDQDALDSSNPLSQKNVEKALETVGGAIPFGKLIVHYIKEKSGKPSDPGQVIEDAGTTVLGIVVDQLLPGSSSLIPVVKDIFKKLINPLIPNTTPTPAPGPIILG